MGYNTTVVILNDALGDIANDPDFGRKLADAILRQSGNRHEVVNATSISPGGTVRRSSMAAIVVEQHHADETTLVAVGGNTAAVVHTQSGGAFLYKEDQDAILKEALLSKWRR